MRGRGGAATVREMSEHEHEQPPPGVDRRGRIDTTVPSLVRMYDYVLGGKDNLAVDRDAADKVLAAYPEARLMALQNRGFLTRAVDFLARSGVRQFLDLGTGLPTSPNVHEIVRAVHPDAPIVYVDNNPVVMAHIRALLARPGIVAVEADIREPETILDNKVVRDTLDFTQPIAVLAVAVVHFIRGAGDIIATYRDALPPGSYLALSAASRVGLTEADIHAAGAAYTAYSSDSTPALPMVLRTQERFEALFAGTELVPPGVVPAGQWLGDDKPTRPSILAGVGRVP